MCCKNGNGLVDTASTSSELLIVNYVGLIQTVVTAKNELEDYVISILEAILAFSAYMLPINEPKTKMTPKEERFCLGVCWL